MFRSRRILLGRLLMLRTQSMVTTLSSALGVTIASQTSNKMDYKSPSQANASVLLNKRLTNMETLMHSKE